MHSRSAPFVYGMHVVGIDIDGHEREEVIEYRTESVTVFVKHWLQRHEPRMVYDNNGEAVKTSAG